MLYHLSVIRSCADYRMPSVPALGGRPYGGRANAFPPFVVVYAVLPRRLRGVDGCHGTRDSLPWLMQLACLGAFAGVAGLAPLMASLVLHVLQHPAAALRFMCSVGSAAGRSPRAVCGLAQLAAAPLGAAAEALQPLITVACY